MEYITLHDLRGTWADDKEKKEILSQLNKKIEKIEIKAKLDVLEDVYIRGYPTRTQLALIDKVKELDKTKP